MDAYVIDIFRIHAPAEKSLDDQKEGEGSVLGVVPHQLRGQLSSWKTLLIEGAAYDRCTGCSAIVNSIYTFIPINPSLNILPLIIPLPHTRFQLFQWFRC